MYEVEVYAGDPYPPLDSDENQYEAIENYKEKRMNINLTRVWQLSGEEYPYFLFYLISTMIHEFLHLFFYDNKMYRENTAKIYRKIV